MFTSDSEFSLNKDVQLTNEVAPQDYFDMLNSAMQNDMWQWFLGYSKNVTDVDWDPDPIKSFYKKMNGAYSKRYGPQPKPFFDMQGNEQQTKPVFHSMEINGAWLPEQDLFLHEIYRYLGNIYPDHPDYRFLLTNNEVNDKVVQAGHIVDYTPDTAYFEYITKAMMLNATDDDVLRESIKMKIRNLLANAGRRKLYGSRMGIRAFGGDVLEHTSTFPVGTAITLKSTAEHCNNVLDKEIDYYNPNFTKKFKLIDWDQDLSIYKRPEFVKFATNTTSLPGWCSYIIETPALFESELFIDDLTNKMRVYRGDFEAEPFGEPLRRPEDYYTDIYEQKWTGYYVNYHRVNKPTTPMYSTCYALTINQEIIDSLTDVNRERLLQIYTAKVLPKQESDMGGAMAWNNFFYSIFEDDVPKVLTPIKLGRFVFTQGQVFLQPKYMLNGYQSTVPSFDKDGNIDRKDFTPFWDSDIPIKQDQFFMLRYPWRTTTDKMAAYAFNDFNKGHIQFANIQKYEKSIPKFDPKALYIAILKTTKNERVALLGYADGELTQHGLNTECRSFRFDIVSIPDTTKLKVNDDTDILHLMWPELEALQNDALHEREPSIKAQLEEKVAKIRADIENRSKLLDGEDDWTLQVSQTDLLYLYKMKGLFIEPVELDKKRCFIEFLDMGTISVLPVMTYNYWEFIPKFIHHFEKDDDSKTIKWSTFINNIDGSKIDFPYCDLSAYRARRTDYNTPAPGYITDNANDLLIDLGNHTELRTIPYVQHEFVGVTDVEVNDGDEDRIIRIKDDTSLKMLKTFSIGDIISGPGIAPDTYIEEIYADTIVVSNKIRESGQYTFYVECKFDVIPHSMDGDFLSYKQDQYEMGNYDNRSVWGPYGGVWPSPNWPRTAENCYLNGLLDFTFFDVNNKFNAFEDVLHYLYKGYFEKWHRPQDGIISAAHIKYEGDLFVEYNIKQLLHMPNRLGVNETLCNVEVLDYLNRNTRNFSKASDKTNIGTQLLINTDTSGVYTLLDGEEYTDPSIKLKAQTYNWKPDTIPYYAGIGVGGNQSMFNTFVHMLSSVYDVAVYDGNYEDFYEKYKLAKEDGLLLTRRHTYQGNFTFDDLGFDYYDNLDKPKYEVELCEYDINHKFTPADSTNALYSCIQANFIKRSFDNLKLPTKLNLNDKSFFENNLIKENHDVPAFINYLDENLVHHYCGDIILGNGPDGHVNYPPIYDVKDDTLLYEEGDYFVITESSIVNCAAPDKYNFFGLEQYETKAPSLLVLARDVEDDTLYWKYCEFQFDGTWGFLTDNISNVPLNEGSTNTVWDQFNNVLDSEANWLKTIEKYHKNVDLASMLLYKHLASNLMLSSQAQDLYFRFTQTDFFENTKTINRLDENDDYRVPEEFGFLMHDPAKCTDPEHGWDITDVDHKIFTFLYTGNDTEDLEERDSGYGLDGWAKPGDLICLYMYKAKEDRVANHHFYNYENTTENIEYDELGHFVDFTMYQDVPTQWRCSCFVIPYSHAIAFGIPLDIPEGVLDGERANIQHNGHYSPYVLKDNFFSKIKLPHRIIAKGSDVLKYILDPKFTATGRYLVDGKPSEDEMEFYVSSNGIKYNDKLDCFTTKSKAVADGVEREFIIKFNETKYFKNLLRFNCSYSTAKIVEDGELKQYGAIKQLANDDFPLDKMSSEDILVNVEEIFKRSDYNNAFESVLFTSDESISTSVYGIDKNKRTVLTADRRVSKTPDSNNAIFSTFITNLLPKETVFKVNERTGYTNFNKVEEYMPAISYSKISSPVNGGDFHEKTPDIDIENQVITYFKNAVVLKGTVSADAPNLVKLVGDSVNATSSISKGDKILEICVKPALGKPDTIDIPLETGEVVVQSRISEKDDILAVTSLDRLFYIKATATGDNDIREIEHNVNFDSYYLVSVAINPTDNNLYLTFALGDEDGAEHTIAYRLDLENNKLIKHNFIDPDYEQSTASYVNQDGDIIKTEDLQQTFVRNGSALEFKNVEREYNAANKFVSFKDKSFGFVINNDKVQIWSKKPKYKYNTQSADYDKIGYTKKSYFTYAQLPTSEDNFRTLLKTSDDAKKLFENTAAEITKQYKELRADYVKYYYDSSATDVRADGRSFYGTFVKTLESGNKIVHNEGVITDQPYMSEDFASIAFTENGPKTVGFGILDDEPFDQKILNDNGTCTIVGKNTQFCEIVLGKLRRTTTTAKFWKPIDEDWYYIYDSGKRELTKTAAWIWEKDDHKYMTTIDLSDIDSYLNKVEVEDITDWKSEETESGLIINSLTKKVHLRKAKGVCRSCMELDYDEDNANAQYHQDKLVCIDGSYFPNTWSNEKINKYRAYSSMFIWLHNLPSGYVARENGNAILPYAQWIDGNGGETESYVNGKFIKIKKLHHAIIGSEKLSDEDWYYYALKYVLGYKSNNLIFTDSIVDIIYAKERVIFLCYDGRAFSIDYNDCYSRKDFENPDNWTNISLPTCSVETTLAKPAFGTVHKIYDVNGTAAEIETFNSKFKRIAVFDNVFLYNDNIALSGWKLSGRDIVNYVGAKDFISDDQIEQIIDDKPITLNNVTYESLDSFVDLMALDGSYPRATMPYIVKSNDGGVNFSPVVVDTSDVDVEGNTFEGANFKASGGCIANELSFYVVNKTSANNASLHKNDLLVINGSISDQPVCYVTIQTTDASFVDFKTNLVSVFTKGEDQIHCCKALSSRCEISEYFKTGDRTEHEGLYNKINLIKKVTCISQDNSVYEVFDDAIVVQNTLFGSLPQKQLSVLISVLPQNIQVQIPTSLLTEDDINDFSEDGRLPIKQNEIVYGELYADRAYIQNEWLARLDFSRSLVRGTDPLKQEDITKYPSSFYDKAPRIAGTIRDAFDDLYTGTFENNPTRGQFYSYGIDIRQMDPSKALTVEPNPIENRGGAKVLLTDETGEKLIKIDNGEYVAGYYYNVIAENRLVACPKPTLSIPDYAKLSYQDNIDRDLTDKLNGINHICEMCPNDDLPYMVLDKSLEVDLDAFGFTESLIDDFIDYLKLLGLDPNQCIDKHDLENPKYRYGIKDGLIYDRLLQVWPINVVKIYEMTLAIFYDYRKGSSVIYNALPVLQGNNVLAPNGKNIVGFGFNKQGYGGYAGNRDWAELPWQIDKNAFESFYALNSAGQPIKLFNTDGTPYESSNADRLYDIDDENIVYAEDCKVDSHDVIDNDTGFVYHLYLEAKPSNVKCKCAEKTLFHKKNTARHCIGQVIFYDERGMLPKEYYTVNFNIDPKNATQWDKTKFDYDYDTGFVYADTTESTVSSKNTITLECTSTFEDVIYCSVELDSYERETLPVYDPEILYSFENESDETGGQITIKVPNDLKVLPQISYEGRTFRYDEYTDVSPRYPYTYTINDKVTHICIIDDKPLSYYLAEPASEWIGIEHFDFEDREGRPTYTVQWGQGTKVLTEDGRSVTGIYGCSFIRMPKYRSFKDLLDNEGQEIVVREISGGRIADPTSAPLGRLIEVSKERKLAVFEDTIHSDYVNDGRIYSLRLSFLSVNDIQLTSAQMNDDAYFMEVPNHMIEKYSPNRVYYETYGYPQPPIEFEGVGKNLENTRWYNGLFYYNGGGSKILKTDKRGHMIVLSIDNGQVLETPLEKGQRYSESNIFYSPSPVHKTCYDWYKNGFYVMGANQNPFWQIFKLHSIFNPLRKTYDVIYDTVEMYKVGDIMRYARVEDEKQYAKLHVVNQINLVNKQNYTSNEIINYAKGIVNLAVERYGTWYTWHDVVTNYGIAGKVNFDEFTTKIDATLLAKYSTCTSENFANLLDTEAGIVQISEFGLFDKDHNLIMYSTFPPIEYRSDKHHLSVVSFINLEHNYKL